MWERCGERSTGKSIVIHPATRDRWNDVVVAFGSRASNPDSCWCQRFCAHTTSNNRVALQHEVDTAAIPIGLLAYVDGNPAGWTRVVPRNTLAGVLNNRALRRVLDEDDSAWWVACFAVQPDYRGTGVGTTLLTAAVKYARENDASALEGHPVDVDKLQSPTASGSALFTGTSAMFTTVGFHEIGRTYPSRPVMRIDLASIIPEHGHRQRRTDSHQSDAPEVRNQ